jgi:hypothetical protein
MQPVTTLAAKMWPGAVVVPEMSTGASDGLYVRNAGIPVYGVSAVFERIDDIRAHGRDERIGVKAFHEAAHYWYQLVKTLASAPAPARENMNELPPELEPEPLPTQYVNVYGPPVAGGAGGETVTC